MVSDFVFTREERKILEYTYTFSKEDFWDTASKSQVRIGGGLESHFDSVKGMRDKVGSHPRTYAGNHIYLSGIQG